MKKTKLMICPKAKGCEFTCCGHNRPHQKDGKDTSVNCNYTASGCPACVEYKKEGVK